MLANTFPHRRGTPLSLQILVISDNGSFAAHLGELLGEAGHAVHAVLEPGEAFRAIRQKKPDLIILAVDAAKVAPLAVEHRVHTSDGTRTVPVIVISECLRLEAELLHVFDFLPKPVDVKRLFDDVAAVARKGTGKGCEQGITEELCREFSGYILSSTGLHFELRNRAALKRGLAKRMTALHMESHSEYLAYLKLHGEDRHELQKLLQFLTVGETYFFRYPAHFEALRERFMKSPPPVGQPIRIWSAGCSTGEEPYSIAITLMEALPDWRNRDIKIIATDINNRSLKQARDGVYSPWAMRITRQDQMLRYFERVGQSFLIKEEVKRLVRFAHLNLVPPCNESVCRELTELDAIFCRNVLIYFTTETAEGMLASLAKGLKPSGQLFLGHAEALLQHGAELETRRHGKSFYYLKKRTPRPRGSRPPHQASEAALPAPPTPQPYRPAEPPASGVREEAAPPPAPQAPSPLQSPLPSPELQAARELFDREDFDRALELVDRLLEERPDETDALVLKGFIQAGKGELTEALATCGRAIAANDLLAEAYFLRGLILDAGDRLDEAADEYRKALLLEHDFIMPRYYMGRLHLRAGRVAEAAREIRNSIRILAKYNDDATVPYSGGLTRAVCMLQLQNALAQVA